MEPAGERERERERGPESERRREKWRGRKRENVMQTDKPDQTRQGVLSLELGVESLEH